MDKKRLDSQGRSTWVVSVVLQVLYGKTWERRREADQEVGEYATTRFVVTRCLQGRGRGVSTEATAGAFTLGL